MDENKETLSKRSSIHIAKVKPMRVVITGMGVVSPLGCNVDKYWRNLVKGTSGIRPIVRFDTRPYGCKIAGQALDFKPLDFFPKKILRRMDRFSQMGLAAAQMAWKDAGLSSENVDKRKAGVVLGTGIGGMSTWEEAFKSNDAGRDGRSMDAFTIPCMMNNAASAHISMHFGLKGLNHTINTACSAGANAIGQAFLCLRGGHYDLILCGGADAPITPQILKCWHLSGILSQQNSASAVRPFDRQRDGFVLAEGAAVLALEPLDLATRRKAHIYAEVTGFASNCDAYHLTTPSKEGAVEAIRLAIEDARLSPQDIDYINAHGTATSINDRVETAAIKEAFGDSAYQTPISSNKSMIGHAMGASSSLEFVATVLSVKNDIIPPTINYEEHDPECDLNYTPRKPRAKRIVNAVSNAFGFGGSNAVLVVRKWSAEDGDQQPSSDKT